MKKFILSIILIIFCFTLFSFTPFTPTPLINSSQVTYKNYLATLIKFYTQYTNNHNVSKAIIIYALQYNLPINLCFALCHTESQFNHYATGYNVDGSKDRGLFQLNSRYFKFQSDKEAYDIYANTNKGLEHLQYCYISTSYNKALSLVAYNMGLSVALNCKGTIPIIRKAYVQSILDYELFLDEEFIKYNDQLL